MMKNKKMNYNVVKNFYYHLIVPAIALIVGLIMFFCINFNLGFDFKGGTLLTVVSEQSFELEENYVKEKERIDKVLNANNIAGVVYQKVETSYYGYAITVKFDKITNENKLKLRQDLITEFYPDVTDENELNIFVKVENFEPNVDNLIINSTILAVLVMLVAVFIYVSARFGLSSGFLSLIMSIFDLLIFTACLIITRVPFENGTLVGFAYTGFLSMLMSTLFVIRTNQNLKKEKYAKTPNNEIAEITVKENFYKNIILMLLLLLFTLSIGVIPTILARSISISAYVGTIVVLYTSFMVMPGLWGRCFIKSKRKAKQQVQPQKKSSEPKLTDEDINKQPEVIVETEAKE